LRRTEARSRGNDRPAGVTHAFQVSVNKVEPSSAVLSRNLLSKNDRRLADADEVEPRRPQVPLVSKPASFACRGERLARAGSGPHGAVVGPSGEAQRGGPDSDAAEEMALTIPGKVGWSDVLDASLIHVSRRDHALAYQVPQPVGGERIDLVIVGGHTAPSACSYLVPQFPQPIVQEERTKSQKVTEGSPFHRW
jgi:hypothetical protein